MSIAIQLPKKGEGKEELMKTEKGMEAFGGRGEGNSLPTCLNYSLLLYPTLL